MVAVRAPFRHDFPVVDEVPGLVEHVEHCTVLLRENADDLWFDLRQALLEHGIEASQTALADYSSESPSFDHARIWESHHVVVVDSRRRAFHGTLHRMPSAFRWSQWKPIPARPIADRDAIMLRFREHRYTSRELWPAAGRAWEFDPSITDVSQVIYNDLVLAAVGLLDRERRTV